MSGLARVLFAPPAAAARATPRRELRGDIEVRASELRYGQRTVLERCLVLIARPGTRTAIIGPTAAGKSQLLFAMTGLMTPSAGEVLYDGQPIGDYDQTGALSRRSASSSRTALCST